MQNVWCREEVELLVTVVIAFSTSHLVSLPRPSMSNQGYLKTRAVSMNSVTPARPRQSLVGAALQLHTA